MPAKTLRDKKLGGITLRLVQLANGTLAGRYSYEDGAGTNIFAEPNETQTELWARLRSAALKADPSFVGFRGAILRFLEIFPDGFSDSDYLAREREYKVNARKLLNSTAPLQEAAIGSGFAEAIIEAYAKTNIVHPVWEAPRMANALRSENGDNLIQRLARFTLGDRSQLSAINRIARKYEAAKWPIVTYLPFLWNSDEPHVMLRHEPTTIFASSVGHEFPHVYEAQLVPTVYESLLDLFATTEMEIAALEPRDLIDVQSFIWVVSKYRD